MRSSSRLTTSSRASSISSFNRSLSASAVFWRDGSRRASKRSTMQRCDVWVVDEGVFHVVLGERRARLPEVLAVGPEDRDLTPRQAGAQDEAVEAVVLDGAAPRAGEGVLEDLLDLRGLELAVGPVDEAEVVDPDRGGARRLYLVRALVHHLDAHVFQKGQDARERDLIPQPEQLEPEEVLGLFYGVVEAHPQVVLGLQGLHAQDVGDGGAGNESRRGSLGRRRRGTCGTAPFPVPRRTVRSRAS